MNTSKEAIERGEIIRIITPNHILTGQEKRAFIKAVYKNDLGLAARVILCTCICIVLFY